MTDDPVPPRCWAEATDALLALARQDLDAGGVPLPMLIAFEGDDPLVMITLRPFGPDELLQALVEVLSLLLPLGADRLACSLPASGPVGRAREDELDGRYLLVVTADGHESPCLTELTLRPGAATEGGWRWEQPVTDVGVTGTTAADTALPVALSVLLDSREELVTGMSGELRLAAQFGRVVLLGHELVVAPRLARRLEGVTSA